jgi:hypothetical protein
MDGGSHLFYGFPDHFTALPRPHQRKMYPSIAFPQSPQRASTLPVPPTLATLKPVGPAGEANGSASGRPNGMKTGQAGYGVVAENGDRGDRNGYGRYNEAGPSSAPIRFSRSVPGRRRGGQRKDGEIDMVETVRRRPVRKGTLGHSR